MTDKLKELCDKLAASGTGPAKVAAVASLLADTKTADEAKSRLQSAVSKRAIPAGTAEKVMLLLETGSLPEPAPDSTADAVKRLEDRLQAAADRLDRLEKLLNDLTEPAKPQDAKPESKSAKKPEAEPESNPEAKASK